MSTINDLINTIKEQKSSSEPKTLKRCAGKIRISKNLYLLDFDSVSRMFEELKFVPWTEKTEGNVKTFVGYSIYFDEVDSGKNLPFYDVTFNKKSDGSIKMKVERC